MQHRVAALRDLVACNIGSSTVIACGHSQHCDHKVSEETVAGMHITVTMQTVQQEGLLSRQLICMPGACWVFGCYIWSTSAVGPKHILNNQQYTSVCFGPRLFCKLPLLLCACPLCQQTGCEGDACIEEL